MLPQALPAISAAAAYCAGLVFLMAALAKVRHRTTFPATVANYSLLPASLVTPVAFLLPWVEAAAGIALLAGERRWAPFVAALLLWAFALAMAVNIRRGRAHIDCGCGGGGLRQPLHRAFAWRNAVLGLALLPALLPAAPLPPAERAIAAAAGIAVFILLRLLDAVLALPGIGPRHQEDLYA